MLARQALPRVWSARRAASAKAERVARTAAAPLLTAQFVEVPIWTLPEELPVGQQDEAELVLATCRSSSFP